MPLIQELETIPLSGLDLMQMSNKLGNPHTEWILYDHLSTMKTVEDLFRGGVNSNFILFTISTEQGPARIGHWITLIKRGSSYSYYDPYGLTISQDIILSGEPPHLERLLRGKTVEVNRERHQLMKAEVNTCGRHCVVRALLFRRTNAEYGKVLQQSKPFVMDNDVFVSLLTAFLSKSDQVRGLL